MDGIFLEVHDNPSKALSDGANALPLDKLRPLLEKMLRIGGADSGVGCRNGGPGKRKGSDESRRCENRTRKLASADESDGACKNAISSNGRKVSVATAKRVLQIEAQAISGSDRSSG